MVKAIENDVLIDNSPNTDNSFLSKRARYQNNNRSVIDDFLNAGLRFSKVLSLPSYYGELLIWSLFQNIDRNGWDIVKILNYNKPEPTMCNVYTDYKVFNSHTRDAQLLLEKPNGLRVVAAIDVNFMGTSYLRVESSKKNGCEIEEFISNTQSIAKNENIYTGATIEFNGRLCFLNPREKSFKSIVLDETIKADIIANSIGFLKQQELWERYGIPLTRGVLLSGSPGTGKSSIAQALVAEADGEISVITTNAYALESEYYIEDLYELAEDISPTLIIFEDIDLIGQSRMEFGYEKGSRLVALLNAMDGIQKRSKVVTVATTNNYEILDKALCQRPSRFDKIISLQNPSLSQRETLVQNLCKKIPISKHIQTIIASKSEGFSPAQVESVVFSLVIENRSDPQKEFDEDMVMKIINNVNNKNTRQVGFNCHCA